MECYQTACAERPTWKLTLTVRAAAAGAPPVPVEAPAYACWNHRALLARSYAGSRGAGRIEATLRRHGLDVALAKGVVVSITPIFG
jgi:hypothetical protein